MNNYKIGKLFRTTDRCIAVFDELPKQHELANKFLNKEIVFLVLEEISRINNLSCYKILVQNKIFYAILYDGISRKWFKNCEPIEEDKI